MLSVPHEMAQGLKWGNLSSFCLHNSGKQPLTSITGTRENISYFFIKINLLR